MDHMNGNGSTDTPVAGNTASATKEERLQALEVLQAEDCARLERIAQHLNTNWGPLVRQVEALQAQVTQLAEQVAQLVRQFEERLPQDPRQRLQGGRRTRHRKEDGTIAWESVTGEIVPCLRLLCIQAKHLAAYLGVSLRTLQRWMANKVEPEKENLAALVAWLDAVQDNGHEDNRKLQMAAVRAYEERDRRHRSGKTQNSDPEDATR